MKRIIQALTLTLLAVIIGASARPIQKSTRPARGRHFYVAPDGRPDHPGTLTRPLDIVTALSNRTPARPGDTIWLRGGVHAAPQAVLSGTEEPTLVSTLTGTATAPITVRQYPGERAIIDGGIRVEGAWTWYRDFEISNSSPLRTRKRPMGLHVFGPNTRFINLVIHDNGNGIGFWQAAENAEIYGTIIYHNGWEETDDYRGHGHGIYAQNLNGAKLISDVISFNNYSSGMKAYSEQGHANQITFEGNISFNNGAPARPQTAYNRVENLLVGTSIHPVEGARLIANHTYHPPDSTGNSIFIGYAATINRDAVISNNYFVGGDSNHTYLTRWEQIVFSGNTLIGGRDLLVLQMPAGLNALAYRQWDNNHYLSRHNPSPFIYTDSKVSGYRSLDDWQRITSLDQHSTWLAHRQGRPTGKHILLRPNRYDRQRANLAIYNWDLLDQVEVDLQPFLKVGDRFVIRNVQNFFGPPVVAATFNGQPVRVPMTGAPTSPEFNAFVIFRN